MIPVLVGLIIIVTVSIFITKAYINHQIKEEETEFLKIKNEGNIKQTKLNKMVRVSLYGEIIGSIIINPRIAIEETIQKYNIYGWNCHQIIEHSTKNIIVLLIQYIILILTLGLWTFSSGYLLLLEKDVN